MSAIRVAGLQTYSRMAFWRAHRHPVADGEDPGSDEEDDRRCGHGATRPTGPVLTAVADQPMGPSFWAIAAIAAFSRCHTSPIRGREPSRRRALFAIKASTLCAASAPAIVNARTSAWPVRGPGEGEPGGDGVLGTERGAREHHPRRLLGTDAPRKEPAAPRLGTGAQRHEGHADLGRLVDHHEVAVQEQCGAEAHRQPVHRSHEGFGEPDQASSSGSKSTPSSALPPGRLISLRSTPAEKARPFPVSTHTATSGSDGCSLELCSAEPDSPRP